VIELEVRVEGEVEPVSAALLQDTPDGSGDVAQPLEPGLVRRGVRDETIVLAQAVRRGAADQPGRAGRQAVEHVQAVADEKRREAALGVRPRHHRAREARRGGWIGRHRIDGRGAAPVRDDPRLDLDRHLVQERLHPAPHAVLQPRLRGVGLVLVDFQDELIVDAQYWAGARDLVTRLPQQGQRGLEAVGRRPLDGAVRPYRTRRLRPQPPDPPRHRSHQRRGRHHLLALPGRELRPGSGEPPLELPRIGVGED
jgi:hypothetical protein